MYAGQNLKEERNVVEMVRDVVEVIGYVLVMGCVGCGVVMGLMGCMM